MTLTDKRADEQFRSRTIRSTGKHGRFPVRALAAARAVPFMLVLALAWTALLPGSALAHKGEKHGAPDASAVQPSAPTQTTLDIPDVVLRDVDNRPVSIRRALNEGRVTVLSFIYTTCSTICPTITVQLAELERRLAQRPDVSCKLISVSVDPVTDTPERLKFWSAAFEPGPDWTFLTGDKQDVDAVLKAIEIYTPDFRDHSSLVFIGTGLTGQWTRASAFADPDTLIELIRQVATRRQD